MTQLAQPLVYETAVVTGQGPITLTGVPVAGFISFADSYATNSVVPYFITDTVSGYFEFGQGTFASGTLTRTLPQGGTDGTQAVVFAGNLCNIYGAAAPAIVASQGAISQGRIPMLNSAGQLDSSFLAAILTNPVFTGLIQTTNANPTPAGTTQGTATLLTTQNSLVSSVGLNTGVVLSVIPQGACQAVWNIDTSGNVLSIYPPSGHTINTLGANQPFGMIGGQTVEFYYFGGSQWATR